MNYWLAVGIKQNWDTAFDYRNIWGLRETQRHLWENLSENDKVLFYVTKPVGGIIGYGVVRTKFKQDQPLWPEELQRNEVIWPLRFEFDIESCLPEGEWKNNKLVSKEIMPRTGFQLLNKSIAEEFISALPVTEFVVPNLLVREELAEYETATADKRKAPPSHDDLQRKLIEIGKLQGYLAESEYPFAIGKLDVVWRRVPNSVPTYVFEIQVGGDIYHALTKLKDAFDLWNSHIFIVASDAERGKAANLLSGAFHEINRRIKFIELNRVEELYTRKKAYFDLEKELGI
jgi:predicted RNA-binding protein